jgi:hypothetical protein
VAFPGIDESVREGSSMDGPIEELFQSTPIEWFVRHSQPCAELQMRSGLQNIGRIRNKLVKQSISSMG